MKAQYLMILLIFIVSPSFSSTEWNKVISKENPGSFKFDLVREDNKIRLTLNSKIDVGDGFEKLAYINFKLTLENTNMLTIPVEIKRDAENRPYVEFDVKEKLFKDFTPVVVVYIGVPGLKGISYSIMLNSYFDNL